MKKLVLSLLILSILVFVSVNAIDCYDDSCTAETVEVYFFWGEGCPHCANVKPYLNQLESRYSFVKLRSFEIYFNETNKALYNDFIERYGVQRSGIPAVFVGTYAIIGDKNILDGLDPIIGRCREDKVCPLTYNKDNVEESSVPQDLSPDKKIDLTWGAVIIAAFADSINPCAFSVLIILLITLSSLGAQRRMLKVGLAMIITVFITYFLSGLGLLMTITRLGLTPIIFTIAGIVALVFGIINLKDFFWYGKGISLSIPKSKMKSMERYIKKASVPAAIILGFLVAVFELPCTGGVYLAVLSLLAKSAVSAVPYLLFYNLIFVLPLVIILLLINYGLSADKVDSWRVVVRKYMKLIMGFVMILLGIAMLFRWI